MADMEKELLANENAEDAETDVTLKGQSHDRKKIKRMAKRLPKQQMGKCKRCGYLSSQEFCQACKLLEGLNKNRPRTEIQVSVEDENNSLTLTRRMEGLRVIPGQRI